MIRHNTGEENSRSGTAAARRPPRVAFTKKHLCFFVNKNHNFKALLIANP